MSELPGVAGTPAGCVTPLRPTTWAWLAALLGWTVFLCFYDLAGGARFEPIDCWVAQTAREMLEAGDWLVPRFSGETRMQKSPGPYWAVMLVSVARGTGVDEVSARIPNGVAAVVLVLTIFWLTRRVAGDRAAVFAGFAASSSVLILWWSHRGASDLGLTTFTTLSLAALWVAAESEPPSRKRNLLFLLGYFAAGLGMLYKMPMPLAIVGAPAFFYVLLRNRWRVFAHPIHLLGIVCFLLPWLPWALAVMSVEDAALLKWKVEFFDRYTGALPNVDGQGGWKNIAFYLPVPLLYCLPYSLSLPGALTRPFRRAAGANRDGLLFAFIWFVSLLVFFTTATGKEYRYFLPALPPLFVLLGVELAAFFDPQRAAQRDRDRWGALAVWTLLPLTLAGGAFGLWKWWELRARYDLADLSTWTDVWVAYAVTAGILAAGFGWSAWLYVRRREHASFAALVATMWVMWLVAWPQVMPKVMAERPFVDFAGQLVAHARAEVRASLRMVGSQDSRIVWYNDIRYPRVIDQLDLLLEQQRRFEAGEQKSRRDLEYEIRRNGEEMIKLLEGDQPAFFIAALPDYVKFMLAAPPELKAAGRTMPPVHLWLQTRYGGDDRQHFVLFGNRRPPFAEPALRLSDKGRAALAKKGLTWAPTSAPAEPTSRPATE